MKTQKTKLLEFSHAIYSNNQLNDLSSGGSDSLKNLNERLLGPTAAKMISIFHDNTIDAQREMLDKNPRSIIQSFLDAAFTLEADKNVLLYVLPYIDAIIVCALKRQPRVYLDHPGNLQREQGPGLRKVLAEDPGV